MTSGLLGFGAISSGPVSSGPEPAAGGGSNALRRLLQSQYAADERKRAEGQALAARGMFSPDTVQTKQQQIQALEKAQNEAILSEDDDDILPFLGH